MEENLIKEMNWVCDIFQALQDQDGRIIGLIETLAAEVMSLKEKVKQLEENKCLVPTN